MLRFAEARAVVFTDFAHTFSTVVAGFMPAVHEHNRHRIWVDGPSPAMTKRDGGAALRAHTFNEVHSHARKCKADSARENGFIFALDSTRLFGVSRRMRMHPALNECVLHAQSGLGDVSETSLR